jgi:hypothetical protein
MPDNQSMRNDCSERLATTEQIETDFRSDHPESIHRCQEPLQRFVSSGLATRAFKFELRRLLDDSNFLGDWCGDYIVFHRGVGYILEACVAEDRRHYIHSLQCYA